MREELYKLIDKMTDNQIIYVYTLIKKLFEI